MRIYSIVYLSEKQLRMQLFNREISWPSGPESKMGSTLVQLLNLVDLKQMAGTRNEDDLQALPTSFLFSNVINLLGKAL